MTQEEREYEAKIDRWVDGSLDGIRNVPKQSADPDYVAGWLQGQADREIEVVLPVKPEGYYHMPVGTFD